MLKKYKLTFTIPLLSLLISCGQPSPSNKEDKDLKKDTSAVSDQKQTDLKETRTDFKLISGKIMELIETHPNGASLSNIKVCFKNDSASALDMYDIDPLFRTFPADLDGNGFGEIYVITQSAGSGSYGNVYGFASNKDRSISMVYLPEISEEQKKKGGPFEGYEGHDLFEINGKQLVRSFPVKETTRTITYIMKQGEAGYILEIQSAKTNSIPTKK